MKKDITVNITVIQRELEFDYLQPKVGPRIEDYFDFCREVGGRLTWPFFEVAVDRNKSRLLTKRDTVALSPLELALLSEVADRSETLSVPNLGILNIKPGLKLRVFN